MKDYPTERPALRAAVSLDSHVDNWDNTPFDEISDESSIGGWSWLYWSAHLLSGLFVGDLAIDQLPKKKNWARTIKRICSDIGASTSQQFERTTNSLTYFKGLPLLPLTPLPKSFGKGMAPCTESRRLIKTFGSDTSDIGIAAHKPPCLVLKVPHARILGAEFYYSPVQQKTLRTILNPNSLDCSKEPFLPMPMVKCNPNSAQEVSVYYFWLRMVDGRAFKAKSYRLFAFQYISSIGEKQHQIDRGALPRTRKYDSALTSGMMLSSVPLNR